MARKNIGEIARHFLLYSKGHYMQKPEGEHLLALRVIIDHCCSLPPGNTSEYSAYKELVNVFIQCCSERVVRNVLQEMFLNRATFETQLLGFRTMADRMISELCHVVVFDGGDYIYDLGSPDEKIYPIVEAKNANA